MVYRCANAYYFRELNAIGGIESHLYYIAKKYRKLDIMVFCQGGDSKQIKRLSKYVRIALIKSGDRVVCDKVFCCFNREILDICEANERNLVLHGDYLDMVNRKQLDKSKLPVDKRIDNYYAVSQQACDSWKALTGIDAKCIYEPVELDNCGEPILLVSATRLSPEKGWERMKKLAIKLNEEKVNYQWIIYTDSRKTDKVDNMILLPPTLNISNLVGMATGFVQLSDNEGYCLSVVEALMRGVPAITTPIKLFRDELGMNESNSIQIGFDMDDIPVDKIRNLPKLKKKMPRYIPKEDMWMEVLEKKPTKVKKVMVKATDLYEKNNLSDAELGYIPKEGEVWETTEERYTALQNTIYGTMVTKTRRTRNVSE